MDTYIYEDIFATKGIEYLAVIAFLFTFLLFLKYLYTPGSSQLIFKKLNIQIYNWFKLEPSFYYSKNHLYFVKAGKNTAYIGLDHFAQKLIGDPDKILFPRRKINLNKGEKVFSLRFGNEEIDIKIPTEIKILQVNKDYNTRPAFSDKSNYKNDWLLKVSIPDIENKLQKFLTGDSVKMWLDENMNRLNAMMSQKESYVLQDGGEIINGFAKEFSKENWKEIVNSFMNKLD